MLRLVAPPAALAGLPRARQFAGSNPPRHPSPTSTGMPDLGPIFDAFKQAIDSVKQVVEVATSVRGLLGSGTGGTAPSSVAGPPASSAVPSGHPASGIYERLRGLNEDARTRISRARSSISTAVIEAGPGKAGEQLEDAHARADEIVRDIGSKLDNLETAVLKEELARTRNASAPQRQQAAQATDAAIDALRGAESDLARARDLTDKPLAPRNTRN